MLDPETGVFELNKNAPIILLIDGMTDHDGFISSLKVSGLQYKQKRLGSTVKNWQSILDLFDEYEVTCCFMKTTEDALFNIGSKEYKEIGKKLLSRIAELPNSIFIYEGLLSDDYYEEERKIDPDLIGTWREETLISYYSVREEHKKNALRILFETNLNLVPYKNNAELSVVAERHLQEIDQNLLFRIYIPISRTLSVEIDKLLQLFKNYLTRTGIASIKLDQQKTNKGILYTFYGSHDDTQNDLTKVFDNFSLFMNACALGDQEEAEKILRNNNVDDRVILDILTKYGKEAKRLQLDIKHETQQKVLSIRQRLESEFIESGLDNASIDIDRLINSINLEDIGIPSSLSMALGFGTKSGGDTNYNFSNCFNTSHQIVDTMHGVLAQEINGDQYISVEATKICELINKYGEDDTTNLKTSLSIIEDKEMPPVERQRAGANLKQFLLRVAKKGGEIVEKVTVNLLTKYIETQAGF